MYRALIADDEPLIRKGMAKQIEAWHLGIEIAALAENGKRTLELAEKFSPEIYIIDINMPFMDGLSCVEKIRETDKNSIIIIVSGYNKFEYAQQAIKHKVDYYLLKPINDDEFRNILKKSVQQYSERIEWTNIINRHAPARENRTDSIIQYINTNYANAAISIESLEATFNLSRSSLFRSIKASTGKSFTDYLTYLRMEHAIRLLTGDGEYPIKDIAYSIGFSDAQYFSRAFKHYTGYSPSRYKERQ